MDWVEQRAPRLAGNEAALFYLRVLARWLDSSLQD
jgi:hypothetical protein